MDKDVCAQLVKIDTFCEVVPQGFNVGDVIEYLMIIATRVAGNTKPKRVILETTQIKNCF